MQTLVQAIFGLVGAIVLVTSPAFAQSRQEKQRQLDWCWGEQGATGDRQIDACTAVIRLGGFKGKDLAAVYAMRGNTWLTKKDYDRAIADFTDALRIDPLEGAAKERGSWYRGRGSARLEKGGDNDRAIADFNDAIRVNPRLVAAYNGRVNA